MRLGPSPSLLSKVRMDPLIHYKNKRDLSNKVMGSTNISKSNKMEKMKFLKEYTMLEISSTRDEIFQLGLLAEFFILTKDVESVSYKEKRIKASFFGLYMKT